MWRHLFRANTNSVPSDPFTAVRLHCGKPATQIKVIKKKGGKGVLPFLYLIVMWRELVQELPDPVLLSRTVDVRNLLLGKAGEIHLDL